MASRAAPSASPSVPASGAPAPAAPVFGAPVFDAPGSGAGRVPVARLAALLADDTRATFLLALLDGRAWTAGELARHAGVAPSTASDHLSRLVAGGLLQEVRQGRHRYLRLAGPEAAHLVEDLAAYAGPPARAPRTLRAHNAGRALAYARTCYDHLAGHVAVAIADELTRRGLLARDRGFALTEAGMDWFATALGHPLTPTTGRRPLVRQCIDWTERRPHLAGVAGGALRERLLADGWLVPVGKGRALRLTPAGGRGLAEVLGLDLPLDGPPARGAATRRRP